MLHLTGVLPAGSRRLVVPGRAGLLAAGLGSLLAAPADSAGFVFAAGGERVCLLGVIGSFVGPVTAFCWPVAVLNLTGEVDFAMDLLVDVSCWQAWLLRRLLVADMAIVNDKPQLWLSDLQQLRQS